MLKKFKMGKSEFVYYFRPGKLLDDVALKGLHNSLVRVNEQSKANVVNKMLDKTLSLEEIRTHLGNTVIGVALREDRPYAFLLSPILGPLGKPILHAGLIIIEKNPGVDLISLLSLGNLAMGYENLGSVYTTNITSTPSIIESFTFMVPGSWPNPNMKLKVPPKGYKEVVKVLKEEYMDVYFPNADKISVNYKHFILTSNSQDMGFTTDFYKISRADNYKYMAFCHSWIDYNKEEDIIQVGEIGFMKYLRMQLILFNLRRGLKKADANFDKKEQQQGIIFDNERKAV